MKFFGSSGIRGAVNRFITPELALSVGKAVGESYKDVILGRDTRQTGYMVAAAVASGITSQGGSVTYAGVLPTPSLAYAAKDHDCGVMITASHNPAPDNGIKLWNPDGSAFNTRQMLEIEELMEEPPSPPTWDSVGTMKTNKNVLREHMDAIIQRFGTDYTLKVVVDCACGAAYRTTPILLREMGCSVITLNAIEDGTFPAHPPEPTEGNLQDLKKMVQKTGADLGIGHDGDGDRMVGFYRDGTYLGGDALLAIFASTRPKKVVVPINSSMVVEDVSQDVIRTKVGDVYVAEKLKEHEGTFGGEPSGTWIFPEISYAPDAIFAAAVLVDLVEEGKIEDLMGSLPEYPGRREAFQVDNKAAIMDALKKEYEELYPPEIIQTMDGLRLDFGDGWSLVRASGTEEKIRITAEAKDKNRLDEIYHETDAVLKKVIR